MERPGDTLLSEGTSEATLPSPGLERRGRGRVSYKTTKLPYSLSQLILQAFENSSACKGLSLAALKKRLAEVGYNVGKHNSRLKRELNSLVSHGLLTRVTGTSGASGSFKVSHQPRKTGKSEPGKKKKAAAVKQSPKANREPQKKAQKRQPPVNKPKNRQRKSPANSGKKSQPNHPATGSNRDVPVKKRSRRK